MPSPFSLVSFEFTMLHHTSLLSYVTEFHSQQDTKSISRIQAFFGRCSKGFWPELTIDCWYEMGYFC